MFVECRLTFGDGFESFVEWVGDDGAHSRFPSPIDIYAGVDE